MGAEHVGAQPPVATDGARTVRGADCGAESVDVVKELMAAFSHGDQQRVLALLDDEATWWVAGSLELSGEYDKQAFGALLAGVAEEMEGGAISLEPCAWTVERDRVAVEAHERATLRNGRRYHNECHFVFELRNGLILRAREYMDTAHAHETFLA